MLDYAFRLRLKMEDAPGERLFLRNNALLWNKIL
jgi:hypothetical protein